MSSMIREIRPAQNRTASDKPVGWGAAIIDEKGNEVPITESMVARACDELARCWSFPKARTMPAR